MRPKKSLGQNFLKSKTILKKIVDVSDPTPDEITLEIGPGKGSLTKELLFFGSKVIAIEADGELVEFLKEEFRDYIATGMLEIIHADILKFDETVLRNYDLPYRVVANIPYYITGAILEKFLASSYQPTSMTLVMQKEVAERIMARPSNGSGQGDGKESILSISVKAYGIPTYHGKIPARYFSPAPKVDSALVHIGDISKDAFIKNNLDEKQFFTIVKAGFAHKRKKLIGNLESIASRDRILHAFDMMSLSHNLRAESVSVHQWFALVKFLS